MMTDEEKDRELRRINPSMHRAGELANRISSDGITLEYPGFPLAEVLGLISDSWHEGEKYGYNRGRQSVLLAEITVRNPDRELAKKVFREFTENAILVTHDGSDYPETVMGQYSKSVKGCFG